MRGRGQGGVHHQPLAAQPQEREGDAQHQHMRSSTTREQAGGAEQSRDASGGAPDGGEIDRPSGPSQRQRRAHGAGRIGRAERAVREPKGLAEVGAEEPDIIGLPEGGERHEQRVEGEVAAMAEGEVEVSTAR